MFDADFSYIALRASRNLGYVRIRHVCDQWKGSDVVEAQYQDIMLLFLLIYELHNIVLLIPNLANFFKVEL